jgi:hypothetical protein
MDKSFKRVDETITKESTGTPCSNGLTRFEEKVIFSMPVVLFLAFAWHSFASHLDSNNTPPHNVGDLKNTTKEVKRNGKKCKICKSNKQKKTDKTNENC